MARTARVDVPKVIDFVILFPVVSSNVVALGHKDNSMFVHYHADRNSETVYRFDGLSKEEFELIKGSNSIGKAIASTGIKGIKL